MRPLNRVVQVEDWSDTELLGVMDAMRPHPYVQGEYLHRKDWECAMSVLALDRMGALDFPSRLLGVGAGKERTLFYLTRFSREVHATDLYGDLGTWTTDRQGMLTNPEAAAPPGMVWEPRHLVVQHMDARRLRYPSEYFDGIFSASSIEHFGDEADIIRAATEMGRVLKPGGVLSLSTEFMIAGPLNLGQWDNILLMTEERLHRLIIQPSGLRLWDGLCLEVSKATEATLMPLDVSLRMEQRGEPHHHVVLQHGPYLFTSVHLALVKDD